MTLMQTTHRRRAAFTLIELMVVMAILTLMLTLLMSGVQRVRVAAKRNGAHTEIYQLGQGVAAFKQKFSVDYFPSKIVLREATATTTSPIAPDAASNNWLREAWPLLRPQLGRIHPVPVGTVPITNGVDWNGDGSDRTASSITLEGDQCLVFFLGGINETGQPSGFSTNKTQPDGCEHDAAHRAVLPVPGGAA